MRHSYAWEMTPRDLALPDIVFKDRPSDSLDGPAPPAIGFEELMDGSLDWLLAERYPLLGRYVCIKGRILGDWRDRSFSPEERRRMDSFIRIADPAVPEIHGLVRSAYIEEAAMYPLPPEEVTFKGRIDGPFSTSGDPFSNRCLWVNAAASRFHPASVGGIVVGVMGCFIFGLYLRRWLRERKALAGTPQQDMIA